MVNNFYTIREVAKNLNNSVKGLRISEIYSQEKNKFLMELTDDNDGSTVLEYSAGRDNIYLLQKHNFSKAKRNYADLFGEVTGLTIDEVSVYNNDRVIQFKLGNNFSVIFTFFVNKANCFILKDSAVINSFKDKTDYSDKNIKDIIPEISKNEIINSGYSTLKDYLKNNYRKFGQMYMNEALYRTNLNEAEIPDENKLTELRKVFGEIENNLDRPEYLLYKKDNHFIVSLISLSHLKDYEKISYENVNHLISEYLKLKFRTEKIISYKSNRENEHISKLKAVEKKAAGIRIQLTHCADSDSLRKNGEIIIQNSFKIAKGEKYFEYTDESSACIKIKLKENLSPVENAQYYFDKYKKQKSSVELLKSKLKNLENEKYKIMKEKEESEEISDMKKIIKEEKKTSENKKDATSVFRKFRINDRYEVWVGKDSASNDLLTTKYSAQNDLWFHVRGASGSHTVLKLGNKKEDAGKEIIHKAASIAAYYSKARNSSSVPVAYCERKYVKKKKGFKQGSVIMEKEKVIFVKPAIPEE
jgi:predicted ribosome quality control (RQC) complex YloA/Tae2 family protein